MWAIGVITYFLLNGSPPFDHPTNKDQMQAIIDAKFSFEPKEYWDPISQTAKDFISRCLVADPEDRMTAEEALTHPWLREPGEHKDEVPTQDLLPNVRRKLSTRKKSLKKIVNAVRTVNYMKQIQEALPLEEDITNQDVLHAH
jgi:serine/threonine protein kinase